MWNSLKNHKKLISTQKYVLTWIHASWGVKKLWNLFFNLNVGLSFYCYFSNIPSFDDKWVDPPLVKNRNKFIINKFYYGKIFTVNIYCFYRSYCWWSWNYWRADASSRKGGAQYHTQKNVDKFDEKKLVLALNLLEGLLNLFDSLKWKMY